MCLSQIFFFLLAGFLSSCASGLPVETAIGVTSAILDLYRSSCVVLLKRRSEDSLQYFKLHVELQKQVIRYSFTTTLLVNKINKNTQLLQCHEGRPLYVILSSDTETRVLLSQLSAEFSLSSGRWFMFMDTSTSVEEFFSNIYIPLDCEYVVARYSDLAGGRHMEISLTEVYHVHPNLQQQQNYQVGHWSVHGGLTWTNISLYQRRNFHGVTLRGAKLFGLQEIVAENNEKKITVEENNYNGQIWTIIERSCNFTTTYIKPADGLYGYVSSNGTLHGLLRMVNKSEAEISVDIFDISRETGNFVEYLPAVWKSRLATYIKYPSLLETRPDLLLAPFSAQLWWIIVAAIPILLLSLTATWCLSDRHNRHTNHDGFAFSNSWFVIIGSFCQQGHSTAPQSWSCRLVFLISYIIAVIIFTAYSAVITSYLTVTRPALPFSTFQGLLEDGTYDFGILRNSTTFALFQNSTDPVIQTVYLRLVKPYKDSQPADIVEALQRLCNHEKYSFMAHLTTFLQYKNYMTCEVIDLPKISIPGAASFTVPQNSPYRRFLKRKVHDITRFGILNLLQERVMLTMTTDNPAEESHSAITMTAVTFILLNMALGTALSIAVFIVEVISHCQKQRSKITK